VGGLRAGEIWQATLGALRQDFGTLTAVAAPFVLLVSVTLALFGPAPPTSADALTLDVVLLWLVLPTFAGAIAQLAIARLVAQPGAAPRAALAAAVAVWPAYIAASLLAGLATGLGFVALILPGVYLFARLFPLLPVALEGKGPVATLRRTWELTRGHGGQLMLFVVLALLFVLGASVLAGGVGSALGAVFTLVGLKPVGLFAKALADGIVATLVAMANAAAATVIYTRLS